MRATVLQEIVIDGQSAGPGSPTVDITDMHGKLSFFFSVSGFFLNKRRTIIRLVQ
jgi:hypothetical protein